VRKRVYLLTASSVLMLAALTASGQSFGAQSAAQGRAAAPALDPELTDYRYPHPVSYHELDTQGQRLRMAYMDVAAARPNGRTVLLLHGKNFSGAYWAATIKALMEAGYRVVVPDQVGFGKSSKPGSYQFSFQALAANTRALLDSLRVEKCAVVGHSMGDYPALGRAAARRIPRARLVEIEEAGHLPQVDSFAKYVRALLDFIAGR
jgi:pimeloyl-ACP methyl ester carboxylesterase